MLVKKFLRMTTLLCLVLSPSIQATESAMPSFEILESSITKSPNDKRHYQVIRLANQLQVLLVSDPDLKNSAASLSVPVGSMHNPDQQLGLAHYLEHMLFLGSERYPVINEYSKFMSQNGGYTNAYTAQDSTVYGFEVNDSAFPEALDRLADVMRAPSLDAKYADKERHTVNAEHKTYFDNDMRKLYALQRYSLNPKHPMARFSTGDLETLKDKPGSNLQQELELFFKEFYSANLMKVALTSPRDLADMQALAVLHLSQIPNRSASKPIIMAPLVTDKQLAVEVQMKPTKELKLLQVNFLIPSVKDEYMYQPGGYISRLLGSDHQGGLSDYLKQQGLAESVMASFYGPYSEQYSQFSMQFKLTKKGLKEQDKVIASLFAYIKLVREKGVNELQYSEQKKSLDNYFQFLPKSAGFNYVMSLSANMQRYPLPDLLYFPFRLDAFNDKFITQLLGYLTPENSRLFLVSPDAEVDTQIPFYQGQYSQNKITEQRLQTWLAQAELILPNMTLPSNNEWLPENVEIVAQENQGKAVHLINETGLSIWYKQSQLGEPKGIYKLQLNNSLNDESPKARVKITMLLSILEKQLAELNFVTQEAGLSFTITSNNGLLLTTSGYSDKQDKLLLTLIHFVKNLKVDDKALALAKQDVTRRLHNKAKSKAMDLGLDGFRQVVRQPAWSDKTLLATVQEVTAQEITQLAENIFNQSSVRLLALGNFSSKQVLTVAEQIKAQVNIQQQPFYQLQRIDAKPEQGAINYVRDSVMEDDALVLIYLATGQEQIDLAKAELLNKLLKPAFYDQIRTQEQLTYSPFTASFPVNESTAFGLFTQSPAVGSAKLYERFQAFLIAFKDNLNQVKPEQFAEIKQAHISNYLAKPNNLSAEFSFLSSEWASNKPQIDSKMHYVQLLESVSLAQVQQFYNQQFFDEQAAQKIIIQVKGSKFVSEKPLMLPVQNLIEDIDQLPKGIVKQK